MSNIRPVKFIALHENYCLFSFRKYFCRKAALLKSPFSNALLGCFAEQKNLELLILFFNNKK
jgi:hypothetical protein